MRNVHRLVALGILLVSSAAAQESLRFTINEITETGSKRFDVAAIVAYSGLQQGKLTSLAEVREAAAKLANSGAFAQVGYVHVKAGNGMKVEFQLKDKAEDQFVPPRFENLVWFSPTELEAVLRKQFALYNGTIPIGSQLKEDMAAEIQSLLAAKGVTAQVSAIEDDDGKGRYTAIDFTADGAQVRIASFAFPGASPESTAELQERAKTALGTEYRQSNVQLLAASSLHNGLLKRGLLGSSIGVPATRIVSQENGQFEVAVSLPVTEGKQYKFTGVEITGNQHISSDAALQRWAVKPGEVADGEKALASLDLLRDDYHKLGFVEAKLDGKPLLDESAGAARFQIVVQEGPQYSFGKLILDGLGPKSQETLNKDWQALQGKPFNDKAVMEFVAHYGFPPSVSCVIHNVADPATHAVATTLTFKRD